MLTLIGAEPGDGGAVERACHRRRDGARHLRHPSGGRRLLRCRHRHGQPRPDVPAHRGVSRCPCRCWASASSRRSSRSRSTAYCRCCRTRSAGSSRSRATIVESARAMGLTPRQVLWRAELPVAAAGDHSPASESRSSSTWRPRRSARRSARRARRADHLGSRRTPIRRSRCRARFSPPGSRSSSTRISAAEQRLAERPHRGRRWQGSSTRAYNASVLIRYLRVSEYRVMPVALPSVPTPHSAVGLCAATEASRAESVELLASAYVRAGLLVRRGGVKAVNEVAGRAHAGRSRCGWPRASARASVARAACAARSPAP